MAHDLTPFVTANDVRGLAGSGLTAEIVSALAAGFVDEIGAAGQDVVVGHDARQSSPEFAAAFAAGARARGADVVSIGVCSSDETYYASGSLNAPAVMITASHNPADYNGIKFSRAGAEAISLDTGLASIRDRASEYLDGDGVIQVSEPGSFRELEVLAEYAEFLRGAVDLSRIRPLRIVVDAGNGMAGLTVPAVLGAAAGQKALPIDIIPLFFELDGRFPNHEPNPLDPANLVDLQQSVVEHEADLGLAFDGDADRCFVVDERGRPITPSAIAAIVVVREIARAREQEPADEIVVLHNLLTSRALAETIEAAGAVAIRTKAGHSLIKDTMRQTGAIFGAEHSAHYYFRDFWGADNGMLAAMHLIAEFGLQADPLSALADRYTPYQASGEINSIVDDVPAAYARIVDAYASIGEFDELDGLTVSSTEGDGDSFWWFNVRPSSTEQLVRLNVEASTTSDMEHVRDAVLELIRE
ncbi:MAG TPA: phosphomannomutase/phosphoglucomutase [Galbitalea sp.]|jgi:phosphomannomutase